MGRSSEKERERGDINHLSIHQWLRSAIPDSQQPTSPIGFLFLKLPPPPCAVLLVFNVYAHMHKSCISTFRISMPELHETDGFKIGTSHWLQPCFTRRHSMWPWRLPMMTMAPMWPYMPAVSGATSGCMRLDCKLWLQNSFFQVNTL